jgi:hypothetical protein
MIKLCNFITHRKQIAGAMSHASVGHGIREFAQFIFSRCLSAECRVAALLGPGDTSSFDTSKRESTVTPGRC